MYKCDTEHNISLLTSDTITYLVNIVAYFIDIIAFLLTDIDTIAFKMGAMVSIKKSDTVAYISDSISKLNDTSREEFHLMTV